MTVEKDDTIKLEDEMELLNAAAELKEQQGDKHTGKTVVSLQDVHNLLLANEKKYASLIEARLMGVQMSALMNDQGKLINCYVEK